MRRILKSDAVPRSSISKEEAPGLKVPDTSCAKTAIEAGVSAQQETQSTTLADRPLKPLDCSVSGCSNRNPNRTFHRLPGDSQVRAAWEDVLGMAPNPASRDAFVCSGHFHQSDFEDANVSAMERRTFLKEVLLLTLDSVVVQ